MRPKLVAVEGNAVAKPRWRPKFHQVAGAAIVCAGLGLGVWQWHDPTLNGMSTEIGMTVMLLCLAWMVRDHGRRNPQPPPREPDQIVRHEHVRRWW